MSVRGAGFNRNRCRQFIGFQAEMQRLFVHKSAVANSKAADFQRKNSYSFKFIRFFRRIYVSLHLLFTISA